MGKTAFFFNDDAAALIEAIRNNKEYVKAGICDAFANVVFQCEDNPETWGVLKTFQEYAHLVDVLAETSPQISPSKE